METAAVLVSLIILLCVMLGVVAVVKATRAVRRGAERVGGEVRRGIDETVLKVRSAQPGPVGEAARTRLELRSSIDSTRCELAAAAVHDPSLSEAVGLLDRLHDHARVLDRELGALIDREPDKVRIVARLPELQERVACVKQSADSLRQAAQDRAVQHNAVELDALREQIEIESGALRHWAPQSVTEIAPQPEAPKRQLPDFREDSSRGAS